MLSFCSGLEAGDVDLSPLTQGVNWTKMTSHIAKQNQSEDWSQALGPACPQYLTCTSLSPSFARLQLAPSETSVPRRQLTWHLSSVDASWFVPCGLIPGSPLFSSVRHKDSFFWAFALIATLLEAAPCHCKGPTEKGRLKKRCFLPGECNPTTGENTCKAPRQEWVLRPSYPCS